MLIKNFAAFITTHRVPVASELGRRDPLAVVLSTIRRLSSSSFTVFSGWINALWFPFVFVQDNTMVLCSVELN